MKKRPSAFTLIELLIVVAIIAILAAIAVPNFLEAQTRSKVAKVIANMRSLTTAVESYSLEWNVYPWRTDIIPIGAMGGRNWWSRIGMFNSLTTPIAYVSNVIQFDDVFHKYDNLAKMEHLTFEFINTRDYYQHGKAANPEKSPYSDTPPFWYMRSYGPDNFGGPNPDRLPVIAFCDIRRARLFTGPDDPMLAQMTYDPSNGTVSYGDIWRYGP